MIETALVFAAGGLTAALIWVLFLPAFWRRVERLTRQRLERMLPLSLNEITADQDRLRAAQAVSAVRYEAQLDAARAEVAAARAELGAEVLKLGETTLQLGNANAKLAGLEADLVAARATIDNRDATIVALRKERDEALLIVRGWDLQRNALQARVAKLGDQAETRRLALDEATTRLEREAVALALAERRMAEMREEVQAKSLALREAERQVEDLENEVLLLRIRQAGGDVQAALAEVSLAPKA